MILPTCKTLSCLLLPTMSLGSWSRKGGSSPAPSLMAHRGTHSGRGRRATPEPAPVSTAGAWGFGWLCPAHWCAGCSVVVPPLGGGTVRAPWGWRGPQGHSTPAPASGKGRKLLSHCRQMGACPIFFFLQKIPIRNATICFDSQMCLMI